MRVRNWAEERKARELRKLIDSIDPCPIKEEPPQPTPSPAMSLWERQTYKPEQMSVVRPGADAHQRYKSRGM
jgi:hypothetical protein